MTDFVLLYTGGDMPETEAEQAAWLQDWGAWHGALGEAAGCGSPFTPVAKTISPDGTVSDVPADYLAIGYTIIKAATLDEAVELTKGCPILQVGGQVSVFETFPVMPPE